MKPAAAFVQKKAEEKKIDPLEHTRYGEGNHPTTNESPLGRGLPLTKPLTITNCKDEHDYTPPYPDRVLRGHVIFG